MDRGAAMNLSVEVISDVICPWCYIGKRRLEKAVAVLDGSTNAVGQGREIAHLLPVSAAHLDVGDFEFFEHGETRPTSAS